MTTIYVLVGSNEAGDVWTLSAHYDYDEALQALDAAIEASEKAGDLTKDMFTLEVTELS